MTSRITAFIALLLMLPAAPASAAVSLMQRGWPVTATAIIGAAWLAFAVWAVIRSARARVQAETAKEWGLRLRGLLTTTPGAYLVVGEDGAASCSDTLRSWLGLDRKVSRFDDLLGAGESGLSPDDYSALGAAIQALAISGAPFRISVAGAGERVLTAEGKTAPPQLAGDRGTVVWFSDSSGAYRRTEALEADRDALSATLGASTAVIDAAPIPIWRRGADQRLVQVNRAYAHAVEAESPAAAVRLGVELVSNPLSATPQSAARLALATGSPQVREEPAIIGGERRMMRIIDKPLENGEVAGYAIDISERDEAVGKLERFVAAQTATFDRLSAGVARFGADRALVFWNTAFAALFRLDATFLDEGPEFDRLFERMQEQHRLPEQRDFPSWRRARRAWFTSQMDNAEETWVLPDTTVLRVIAQPSPDGGLLLIFEDRSEQLRLASSRDTLLRVQEATLNNLHEAVAVFAADGRVQLYNSVFADLLNIDEAHLATKPHVDELADPGAPPREEHAYLGLLRDLIQASTVGRQAKAGRVDFTGARVLQYAAVPLPDGNALITFLDITDSTRIENALRERNEALEAADRQKSAFVENMSYELRTPLTAISGFAEMLAQGYVGALSPKQEDYIRSILISSDRLQLLINDILDLAVTEAGALALDIRAVAVGELVESVAMMTRGFAEDRGLTFEINVPADIGEMDGDPVRLKQALFNLVNNAIRFTPSGGRVVIFVESLPGSIVIRVSDNGIGIPAEEQELVFDRFRKGSNATASQGVGLGLSLVRDVIDLHGGRVVLDSHLGEGTTVSLHIPRRHGDKV
ncbi:sensor histidine kinase [Sphingosinicella microcystinivorans]|uniref:histidine kinase n=1 Tax=Sphingosinicella microcystinivorans TaxID=335406 RepID=A0AAD1G0D5_SPHMI|nr:PAS domain-containing sensor histidine kinase [Sphingosinicella microcystinivorans]RKS90699.1 PAS/PAC sensor signal transduction histidine kinase [Sphingosinicella microcystinivorans]BBE33613.1 two-component sensor histidine kinase [Sphingosinicella microcystinivorans]